MSITKNGDLPAMPQNDMAMQVLAKLKGYSPKDCGGLTKREQFAMAAMQGILAGVNGDSVLYESAPEWVKNIAEASVEFADALLAELERTK